MNWATLLSTPVGELLWKKKQELRRREAAKPAIGATLCCAGLRMTVQAGLTHDLWQWMVKLGWRELGIGESRLHYKPLPTVVVTRLFECPPEERDRVLLAGIRQSLRGATTRVVVPERSAAS